MKTKKKNRVDLDLEEVKTETKDQKKNDMNVPKPKVNKCFGLKFRVRKQREARR